VSEVLNNKPISPGYELADALEEIERNIGLNEPNRIDWGEWVIYKS